MDYNQSWDPLESNLMQLLNNSNVIKDHSTQCKQRCEEEHRDPERCKNLCKTLLFFFGISLLRIHVFIVSARLLTELLNQVADKVEIEVPQRDQGKQQM